MAITSGSEFAGNVRKGDSFRRSLRRPAVRKPGLQRRVNLHQPFRHGVFGEQFGAAAFEHGILQMFVVLALRACIHAEFHTASVSRHHLMLDEVFLFIQAHLTEELTLDRLEKEFFVSREHIAREFKRQTGQTVHRYIVKARLDRCCTLIEQGLPITEVYKTSGFGGYNHFFRAFKKEYGMTPKEYFSTTRQDARG